MPSRILTAAALGAVLAVAAPASAETLCSAPVAPICLEIDSTYEDAGSTERCREDLESYSAQVEAYADCLATAIAELRAGRDELDATFACRVAGGEDCGAGAQ